ncbi:unnamed protein product [Rhizophagus irregularis]|nr:unnamed protein product [Rhizophagus irregularis]
MKKQEKQTDKRRQSSNSRSSRGPFVLSVDGEIRQTPSNRQTTSTHSNRQTEQTSSITPSNRQTTSTPSNHQTEQTSSITPSNRQTISTPSNRQTEQTSSITPSNHQTISTPSNRQTEQTSSITPSNRQTISTPSNRQTEQTSSITPTNRQTTSTPTNRQTEQTSSITLTSRQTNSIVTSSLIKIPKIRLLTSMLLAPPAPRQLEPALTCGQEPSDDLKSENAILRAQNEQLRQQVNEITEQLQTVTSKFNSSQEENQTLLIINNEFGRENDKLYESLERYRGKRLTKRSYDNESSSEDESSSDESEMDEKKARAEMKTILKTVPKTLDMNYNETFTSGANVEIRQKLVPELLNSLKLKYHPTYEQLTQWLRSLHKTRRSRNIYRNKGQLDDDNRRLLANNRLNEKKIRRMKSAKSLYANNNSEISKYNKEELLKILKNRKYHSPEIIESDDDPVNQNKRIICVYDLSWRSDELKTLLRDILDPHSFTIQIARLTRERNYDDELQSYDHLHPPNAPEWSYIEQIDQVYDTEIEGSKTPVYGDNEDSIVGNMPVYSDNEDSMMYNTDEEYAHGESSTTGMIRGAILEADSQQKDKNKKIE